MRSSAVWAILVVAGLILPQSGAQTECPVDVLFILDHSGSISDNDETSIPNWLYIIDTVADVVRATASYPSVRYAAISYGTRADIEFNLDRYTQTFEYVVAFRSIRNSGGNTNTTGALRLSRTGVWSSLANRPNTYDVAVLITDGWPSERYEGAGVEAEADRLKAMGVRLIGIGVTTAVNAPAIRRIVTQPSSENYFGLSNFTQLPSIVESLVRCIVSTTPTTYPHPSPETTTTGSTSTTTQSTSSTVSTMSTSTPGTTTTTLLGPDECRHQADVVIVLDASGGRMSFTQFNEVISYHILV